MSVLKDRIYVTDGVLDVFYGDFGDISEYYWPLNATVINPSELDLGYEAFLLAIL